MSYSITRDNGFMTLEHTDGWMVIISANELLMSTDGSDLFSFSGIQLDFNDCTSPSGSTSATDLMTLIRDLV